jgi:CheY-like chemotaxis protein
VSLQPAAAQSLALALHELVTNAAKYGALSSMSGRVHLTWELNPGQLVLKWTESGGPATQAPSSPGFGTRIITASIEGQLAGQTIFDWRPEGLQCILSVPRDDMTPVKGHNGKASADVTADSSAGPITVAGNRVMIVEDEALVAMALRESLDGLGFSVLGPFNRISEAMIALRNNRIDAAVLDVNLGGELIYPLADVLAADHVPFVFITGYGAEEIEPRYARVPVLQKPIEVDALKSVFVRSAAISGAAIASPARWMVG